MNHLDSNDLAAWIDGWLDPAGRSRMESHLAECPDCRARLAAQVRAESTMRGTVRSWRPLPTFLLLAAVVATLLLGVGLYRALESDRPPVTAERGAVTSDEPTRGLQTPASTDPGGGRPRATSGERLASTAAGEGATGDRPTPAPVDDSGSGRAPVATPGEGPDPSLLALRGATRRVDGKVFRLREGAWVDDAWTDGAHRTPTGLEPIELERGSRAYATALSAHPEIGRYAEIGPTVVVVIEDSLVYRILSQPALR
ncbi:MAG: anti-sigma factor family protein [Gemmatimonadota bacterium]